MARQIATIAVAALVLAGSSAVADIELINNGGFETGDFTGWTVVNRMPGHGSFVIDDANGRTPISRRPTVGPAAGSYYAVSDQFGPGTHALLQEFTVPTDAESVVLSYDMFVNNWAWQTTINPSGLTHLPLSSRNQHGRVDILAAGSEPFDTTSGVLGTFYLGADPGQDPHAYTHYDFDITDLVGAGGTFVVRFAETDNRWLFNMGVDNVSVAVAAIPAPAAVVLGMIGLVLVGRIRKRLA